MHVQGVVRSTVISKINDSTKTKVRTRIGVRTLLNYEEVCVLTSEVIEADILIVHTQ